MSLNLKLNKSLSNLTIEEGPNTPLEQTLKTPLDPPNGCQNGFFIPPQQSFSSSSSLYSNNQMNESDDLLSDLDDANTKATKCYKLGFTSNLDQLILGIYTHILHLPTTTPFLGLIPPSGLVSKVANEVLHNLLVSTSNNNHPLYDQQSVINHDFLRNFKVHPIFLQLIRKRLIELCTFSNGNSSMKLPVYTSINVTVGGNSNRKASISNMALTDGNLYNLNQNNRSRSSSLNLRKQSLTRNNSYNGGNNWLHIGNLNNIRQHNNNNNENVNGSTDSLQSMLDFVPQALINKSANTNNGSVNTPVMTNNGFNSMMMDYQTPPTSHKSSVSSSSVTPPNNIQVYHHATGGDYDDFSFCQQLQQSRSRSSSRGDSFPNPLTINTEHANMQAFNVMNNNATYEGETLDSPFMSATTPSDNFGYFAGNLNNGTSLENQTQCDSPKGEQKISLPNQFTLSEKKRDSLKLKRGIL